MRNEPIMSRHLQVVTVVALDAFRSTGSPEPR